MFPPRYHGLNWKSRKTLNGLGFGLVLGLVDGLVFDLVDGLGLGLMAGLTAGLVFGLVVGLTGALQEPLPTDRLITPIESWLGNRQLTIVLGLVVGLAVGLAVGLVAGLVFGLVFGLTAGLVAGLVSDNGSQHFYVSCAAFIQLRAAGQGPVRIMRFLEDARARGVLRTAGP